MSKRGPSSADLHSNQKKPRSLSISPPPPSSFKIVVQAGWDQGKAVDWDSLVRDEGKKDETLGVWTEGRIEPEWVDSLLGKDVIVPGCWVASPTKSQRGFITNFHDNLFTIYFQVLDTFCTISYPDIKKIMDYSQFNIEPQHLPFYIPTVLKLG